MMHKSRGQKITIHIDGLIFSNVCIVNTISMGK